MSTTVRKPRPPCRTPGCKEQSTNYAPVWDKYWTPDADDWVEQWGDRWFCAEHAAEAQRTALRRRHDELLGPFPRMLGWTLDTFPAADAVGAAALARARRWLEDERGETSHTLFIFGGVGSGKTSLALSCLLDHVDPWNGARLFNMRQLLADTRRSFGSKGAADPTDELVETYFAALDDVGAERPTPWAVETLATIVEERYLRAYPTIVTSNYAPSELARRLGHDDPVIGLRIVSRLTEDAVQIRLDRPDLRVRNQPEALLDPLGPDDDDAGEAADANDNAGDDGDRR